MMVGRKRPISERQALSRMRKVRALMVATSENLGDGIFEARHFPATREGVRMFPANVKIDGAQHLNNSIPGDAIGGLSIDKTGGSLGWDRVNSPDHLRTYEKLRKKLLDDGFRRRT